MAILTDTSLKGSTNLKASYEFEGNSTDLSGNSNNGADTNISYVAAKYDLGPQFNGTSSKITITDSATLHFATGDYTFVGWIKPTNLAAGSQDFVGKANSAGQCYIIHRVTNTGACLVQFYTDAGNNVNFTANGIFTEGAWTHIAIVLKRADAKCYLYKNAVNTANGDITGTPSVSSTGSLVLSDPEFSGVYFAGILDSCHFFNRALTDSEIAELYNPKKTSATNGYFDV